MRSNQAICSLTSEEIIPARSIRLDSRARKTAQPTFAAQINRSPSNVKLGSTAEISGSRAAINFA
jgi:hypothetical protein